MRKLILIAAFLFGLHAYSQAQSVIKIENRTKCKVEVTMYCYDLCVQISDTSEVIPAGGSRSLTPCHVPPHPAVYTVFEVCWVLDPDACSPLPPIPCTRVDGITQAPPGTYGAGTFTSQIRYCPNCNPS